MSRPSCPYDNAISENLFKLLKATGIDDYYKDTAKQYEDSDKWVKWYNNVRMRSGLQYNAPKQIRTKLKAS